MSELSFTPAQENDLPILVDVLSDATQHKLRHGDMVWGNEGWTEEEVQDAMTESLMYLVKQDREVIGTVSLQWDDEINWGPQPPIAGYMHRLAVKDGHHGQNIGKRIVDWAGEQTLSNGRSYLRLDCEASNTDLCTYYENLGFTQLGTRSVPKYEDYVAALFEKPLSSG